MSLWARTLFVTALPDEAAPVVERHREHVRELHRAGKLRHAGELGAGDGFLEVFEARDLQDAEATARASPLVEAGLAAWTVQEWTPVDYQ